MSGVEEPPEGQDRLEESPPEIEDIDLGGKELPGKVEIDAVDYRAKKSLRRELLRNWLAVLVLLHLFVLEAVFIFTLWGDSEALKVRLDLFMTTASGIAGVVLGFYFGQSSD